MSALGILTVPSEEAMFALLTGLNVSGVHPELPCLAGQAAFLATLTDPDADYVHIVRTASDGREHCHSCSGCTHERDDCVEFSAEPWPRFPVLALVSEWPDARRCEEDEIDAWWLGTQGGDS